MNNASIGLVLLFGVLAVYTANGFFDVRNHNANLERLMNARAELLAQQGWNQWEPIPSEPPEFRRQYDSLVQGYEWNESEIKRIKSVQMHAWFWTLFAWGIADGWLLELLLNFEFDRFDFRRG